MLLQNLAPVEQVLWEASAVQCLRTLIRKRNLNRIFVPSRTIMVTSRHASASFAHVCSFHCVDWGGRRAWAGVGALDVGARFEACAAVILLRRVITCLWAQCASPQSSLLH